MAAACQYAVLRVVPHVHTGAFVNVGVMLHARTEGFLGALLITDPSTLRRLVPDTDIDMLVKYLENYDRIAAGDPRAGEVALLPTSERFHWMTAPRSDVIQASTVHTGLTDDPATTLCELYESLITQ